MMRIERFLVGLALLLLAWSASGAGARAEEPLPPELRVNAEHVFVDGRLQDLPLFLAQGETALDRFPLVLARRWWRRVPGPVPAADADGGLAARRVAWARVGSTAPPYPLPGGGAEDPYPLLSALVLDRIQRETVGAHGLPEASPLRAYLEATGGGRTPEEGDVLEYALGLQRRSYVGDEDPAEQARLDRHAQRIANQNRVVYLGLLGALLVSAFLATLVVSRDRDARPAA